MATFAGVQQVFKCQKANKTAYLQGGVVSWVRIPLSPPVSKPLITQGFFSFNPPISA